MMKFFRVFNDGKELLFKLDNDFVTLFFKEEFHSFNFKLSINEVRALRDSLGLIIDKFDNELINSLNSSVNDKPVINDEPVSGDAFFNQEVNNEPEPVKKDFKLFSDEPVEDKTEFYY